jgi:hypothetical protein
VGPTGGVQLGCEVVAQTPDVVLERHPILMLEPLCVQLLVGLIEQ